MQEIAGPVCLRLVGKILVGIGEIVHHIVQMRVFEIMRRSRKARRHHHQMPDRHGRHIRAGRRRQFIREEGDDPVFQPKQAFLNGEENGDGRKAFGDGKQAVPLSLLIGRKVALVDHLSLAQKHQRMQPILRLLQLPAELQQPPGVYPGLPGRAPLKILSHSKTS